MKTHKTDKTLFRQGIKYLLICLPLLVIAPVLITLGALNDRAWFFIAPGIIAMFAAMYYIYKGVSTLLKAFFNSTK